METENLEEAKEIAYFFMDKSCDDFIKISYNKLQCMVYQANKSYFQYDNKLLCEINTITSDKCPTNMDILKEFSTFRDRDYISHNKRTEISNVGLKESIFLEYIWYKYSSMKDEELIQYTLSDKVFANKSGVEITKECLQSEESDNSIKSFMDFLIK